MSLGPYIRTMGNAESEFERAIRAQTAMGRALKNDPVDRIRRGLGMQAATQAAQLLANGGLSGPTLETVRATAEAHAAMRRIAEPYGGVVEMAKSFAEQQRQMASTIAAMGGMAELNRARQMQWAAALARPSAIDIAQLMPQLGLIQAGAIDKVHAQALNIVGADATVQAAIARAKQPAASIQAALNATSLKMSVLAGVGEVAGIRTPAYHAAIHGLLGDWRSTPDLPASFWTDRRVRERRYRRADVDPGLIAAPAPVAIEIMVTSGLVTGDVDDQGAVALFGFGGISVAIRSADANGDAYRAVVAFERRMRKFIAERLAARSGPKWFKRRVDATVFAKAAGTREAALKSGERPSDGGLIDYTDLGELKEIVLRADNWRDEFEEVFVNRLRFEHDLMTLMAVRRPVAHSRIVDSPMMVEALLVMKRLDDRMTDDGAWKRAAASDE